MYRSILSLSSAKGAGLCRYMHSVLRIPKKFSAIALSQQLPRLAIDGVIPYLFVSSKYACEVHWAPWSLWSCSFAVTFFFSFFMIRRIVFVANQSSLFQDEPHSAISISLEAFLLFLRNYFCQFGVLFNLTLSIQKVVVSTSGYLKELAHHRNGILVTALHNDFVFDRWPHFLPANCRKFRSSWFSIFSRLISYGYAAMLAGEASFLGRPRCVYISSWI